MTSIKKLFILYKLLVCQLYPCQMIDFNLRFKIITQSMYLHDYLIEKIWNQYVIYILKVYPIRFIFFFTFFCFYSWLLICFCVEFNCVEMNSNRWPEIIIPDSINIAQWMWKKFTSYSKLIFLVCSHQMKCIILIECGCFVC